ncbi:DUF3983 domain-containing protein [Cytobacillus depressus]|uniref:DUF3983 domain-containing protein n=1 Tax=Cytobacillus depressus TaxID=1602942 RepID=A0A6L3VDQ0_9BACI|nr:DUF3983 domain-containing protein [Cytobacillus depressus]KAB2337630.1 DUF3983 domain-containing protein [Cytobacillus depressus]
MANMKKRKRRLGKSLARRCKEFDKYRTEKAWRNIFVKAGVLKNEHQL